MKTVILLVAVLFGASFLGAQSPSRVPVGTPGKVFSATLVKGGEEKVEVVKTTEAFSVFVWRSNPSTQLVLGWVAERQLIDGSWVSVFSGSRKTAIGRTGVQLFLVNPGEGPVTLDPGFYRIRFELLGFYPYPPLGRGGFPTVEFRVDSDPAQE